MRVTRDLMSAALAAEDMSVALDAARALFSYYPAVYPKVMRPLLQTRLCCSLTTSTMGDCHCLMDLPLGPPTQFMLSCVPTWL